MPSLLAFCHHLHSADKLENAIVPTSATTAGRASLPVKTNFSLSGSGFSKVLNQPLSWLDSIPFSFRKFLVSQFAVSLKPTIIFALVIFYFLDCYRIPLPCCTGWY